MIFAANSRLAAFVDTSQKLYSLLKNSRFVSGHRFSGAASAAKSVLASQSAAEKLAFGWRRAFNAAIKRTDTPVCPAEP
jgi:hypothetical protein